MPSGFTIVIVYVVLAVLLIINIVSLILLIVVLNKIRTISIPYVTPGITHTNLAEAYPAVFIPQRSASSKNESIAPHDSASSVVRTVNSLTFCRKCAAELNPEDRYCPKCGLPR